MDGTIKVLLPCDELKAHAQKLTTIKDLREQLRYYNDNICSLSIAYPRAAIGDPSRSGLRTMGQYEGDVQGVGEVFFRLESANDREREIYLEERQREVSRLQRAVNAAQTYPEKLQALLSNRAGQLSVDVESCRVLSNEFQLFLIGLNGSPPTNREYDINLYPTGYDESTNAGFNAYLYNYVKAVQKDPYKYYWLYQPNYKRFDAELCLRELRENMGRAFEKEMPLRSRLKEIEERYRLNAFVNYRDSLYDRRDRDGFWSPFLGGDKWTAAIFNALYNGERFDFGKRVLRLTNIIDLIYTEDEYEFYVMLHRMASDTCVNPKRSNNNDIEERPVDDITFETLFTEQYRGRINEFLNILREVTPTLIGRDNGWTGSKGAAKLFFRKLRENGVMKFPIKKEIAEIIGSEFSIKGNSWLDAGGMDKTASTQYGSDFDEMIRRLL